MGDLLLYLKQTKLKCLCSWQFQYQLNTHYENNFNTTGQQQFSFTWLSRSTWWNETDIYTSFSSHTLQKIGMKLAGWKKVLTDCGKYKNYWKVYTTYFQKFTALQKIRQQKSLFFTSKERQFSNNVLPRNVNVSAWKHTNCATALVTLTASKCTWGRTDNVQPNSWQQHMPQWHNCLRQ